MPLWYEEVFKKLTEMHIMRKIHSISTFLHQNKLILKFYAHKFSEAPSHNVKEFLENLMILNIFFWSPNFDKAVLSG